MNLNNEVSRLLFKIGVSNDALSYWAIYKNTDPNKFAVIKISGQCVDSSLQTLADDIADLCKLKLTPVVTYGWGSGLTKKLSENGISSEFIDGERYTDARVMEYVLNIAQESGEKLKNALQKRGAKLNLILPDQKAIIATKKQDKRYGSHNGDLLEINTDLIYESIRFRTIPIISPIGSSKDGNELYNLNAASVGAGLVKAIDPVKYIMITSSGGVLKDGRLISEIVLRRDYDSLVKNQVLSGGMLKNIDEAKASLETRANGEDKSVQIVGPGNLLQELFSYKGAGTYIRKGHLISQAQLSSLDLLKVKTLIEEEFKDPLKESFFKEKGKQVYFEKNFKGLATVLQDPEGIGPYLDIITVNSQYARNGLGNDLLAAILSSHSEKPKLFWRSKPFRDINSWYFRISEGHQVFTSKDRETYNAFWIGLSHDEVKKAIGFMQARSSNFWK